MIAPAARTTAATRRAVLAWLDRHRADPFVWGRWDCCLAAADWIETATGRPLAIAVRMRETYHSPATARAAARRELGDHFLQAPDLYGVRGWVLAAALEPLPVNLASWGDLAAVQLDRFSMPQRYNSIALGIVAGSRVAVAGARGFVHLPRGAARAAFRLPL